MWVLWKTWWIGNCLSAGSKRLGRLSTGTPWRSFVWIGMDGSFWVGEEADGGSANAPVMLSVPTDTNPRLLKIKKSIFSLLYPGCNVHIYRYWSVVGFGIRARDNLIKAASVLAKLLRKELGLGLRVCDFVPHEKVGNILRYAVLSRQSSNDNGNLPACSFDDKTGLPPISVGDDDFTDGDF